MHTRQRTRNVGRDPDAAEPRAAKAHARKALAQQALGRERGQWRAGSPVCRSGGRWRDRRADAQHGPRCIPRSHLRVRKLRKRERRSAGRGCLSVRVMGAERLRRGRRERGAYERLTRGGVWPVWPARAGISRGSNDDPRDRANLKAARGFAGSGQIGLYGPGTLKRDARDARLG